MMMNHAFLLTGVGVGLSVAVPVGPMSLLCIRRTLTSGMGAGVSTGLGAATTNVFYGTLVLVGLDRAAPILAGNGRVLSFAGGVFLLWSAAQMLIRGRRLSDDDGSITPAAGCF